MSNLTCFACCLSLHLVAAAFFFFVCFVACIYSFICLSSIVLPCVIAYINIILGMRI